VTTHGLDVHDMNAPPGEAVTVYDVTESPPVFTGSVQLTRAELLPRVTETSVGGSGTVAGVTGFVADDSALLPTEFVACTVNVYAVPFASPVKAHGAAEHETVAPPGDAVTT
jgi:hypothetical protein